MVISKNEKRNMQMIVKDGKTMHVKIDSKKHAMPRLRPRMESSLVKSFLGYDPRESLKNEADN